MQKKHTYILIGAVLGVAVWMVYQRYAGGG
jgi:hypothetical protein